MVQIGALFHITIKLGDFLLSAIDDIYKRHWFSGLDLLLAEYHFN
jgi:hypothetical protein